MNEVFGTKISRCVIVSVHRVPSVSRSVRPSVRQMVRPFFQLPKINGFRHENNRGDIAERAK